ncbi:MAG: nucleoside deaminase [Chitinophagales bacterium]
MGIIQNPDGYFMNEALKLAEKALREDEVPIGAVIVAENKIIAKSHNLVERLTDPTAHAEMQSITSACNFFNAKYLPDCTLYVTLEPCPMCAAAAHWAQIGRLVYGATDPKMGYSRFHRLLHPKTEVVAGIEAERSKTLMQNFFRGKR